MRERYVLYPEHNKEVFDEVFVCKYYTEDDDKVALTVTAEDLEALADDITLNIPRLKSFENHCRVLYYDNETELIPLHNQLNKCIEDWE